MRRLLMAGFLLSLCIAAAPATGDANAAGPNIILIMADDVGYECFGCYGSRQYKTPNIDRLAQGGMRFTHCYSQPLCTPSRVKIMTGLYNARNYSAFSVLNRDQRTIGQYFCDAGYKTAIAGKWQLLAAEHYPERFRNQGTWPSDAGFNHACLWQVDRLGERFWGPLLHVDGENRQFEDDAYGPSVVTKYITDFLDANRDKPFFVYYPMILVHSPFVPTPNSASRQTENQQQSKDSQPGKDRPKKKDRQRSKDKPKSKDGPKNKDRRRSKDKPKSKDQQPSESSQQSKDQQRRVQQRKDQQRKDQQRKDQQRKDQQRKDQQRKVQQRKVQQRNFQDMVSYMDELIGRIVRKTEELGIADRTLILFTGDNGTHRAIRSTLNGRTIQGGKGNTTDAGTRVPLVAYWPNTVPAGRVNENLIGFTDFLPTLLEAAGAEPPASLDGQSFLSQLKGETGLPREWIYCYYCPRPERTQPARFVRDRRWKLYGDGRFFDIAEDPTEKTPLKDVKSGSPADAAQRKLAAALQSLPTEGQTLLRFGNAPE